MADGATSSVQRHQRVSRQHTSGTKSETNSVCAVVVSYNPPIGTLEPCLLAVAPQVQRIVVVDNSESEKRQSEVRKTVDVVRSNGHNTEVELLQNGRNLGLSRAINQGVQIAAGKGSDSVLLLDQDSIVGPGTVGSLRRALSFRPRSASCIAVAARNVERNATFLMNFLSRLFYHYPPVPKTPVQSRLAMTSGLLVPITTFDLGGLFDEAQFLDAADYEFCLRVRHHHGQILLEPKATVDHVQGTPAAVALLGLELPVRYASEDRLFYLVRDTLRLCREYLREAPVVCSSLFLLTFARSLLFFLVRSRYPDYYRAVRRGWSEFLRYPRRSEIGRLRS
jgi:rhamnosyltransferase